MISSKSLVPVAIAAMLLSLLLAGCGGGGGGTPVDDTTGSVSGRIVDFTSSTPLAGVEVSIGSQSTTTDANGYFVLEGVRPGTYTLTITPNPETNLVLPPGSEAPSVRIYEGQNTALEADIFLMDSSDLPPTPPS